MRNARTSVTRLFVVLLVVAAAYRLTLLERGALAFVDETFYFTSVMAVQALAAGNLHDAVAALDIARGRQGATLLQLPLAALQAIPSHFGVPASNLRSLLIPAVFNVAATLASLYLFFAICLATCDDEWTALTSTLVYALLVNTNLYVRHMVPYDWALCLGLCALWIAIRRRRTIGNVASTGGLVGMLVTTYSGYFLLAGVIGLTIVAIAWRSDGWRRAALVAVIFAAAAASIVAVMELLFRAGGSSYLANVRGVARDINFSSVDDGWMFLPEYLLRVEYVSGLVLLAGMGVYVWRAGVRAVRRQVRLVDWLVLPAILGWAVQAAAAAEWHAIPLFGRLLHPWMPFMAWALANALTALDRGSVRTAARAAVVGAAVVSWGLSADVYYRLAYPSTALYALGIDTDRVPDDHKLCELNPGTGYASPGPLSRTTGYPYTTTRSYLLLNFCQALMTVPRPRIHAEIRNDATLIYDGPHWMTFPAYAFEGLTHADRAAMRDNDYRVRAFLVGN